MKHHATVQTVRERYNSRREKILKNLLRISFTHALKRGVMLHIPDGEEEKEDDGKDHLHVGPRHETEHAQDQQLHQLQGKNTASWQILNSG